MASTAPQVFLAALASFLLAAPTAAQQRFAETGRMLPAPKSDLNPVSTSDVLLFDADLDGDLDAFLGVTFSGIPDSLYFNDGTGAFVDFSARILNGAPGRTGAVAAGDLDGDGDLDLYVAKDGAPDVVLENVAAGTFAGTVLGAATDERCRAVALGDLDGDGDLDAYVGIAGDGSFYTDPDLVLLNDGSGTFTALGSTPGNNDGTDSVALGDVDGDGDLDAWTCRKVGYLSSSPKLYLNDGAGNFTEAASQVPSGIFGTFPEVEMGDVDGDGDLDLYLVKSSTDQDVLFLNDGTGFFSDASIQLPTLPGRSETVDLGDFDGDGDLDALTDDALLLNNGAGLFSLAPGFLPGIAVAEASSAGDVDGDGDLDLMVSNDYKAPQLLLNDGDGAFLDATATWPLAYERAHAIAAGDLDGDGLGEVVTGSEWEPNHLILNDGGTFVRGPDLPNGFERTREMRLADLDGDQDLDIFLVNGSFSGGYPAEPDRIYLNDGSAGFSDASAQLPGFVEHSRSCDVGDVDGDGDVDLMVGVYDGAQRLYLNDGLANFSDASGQLPLVNDRALAVVLADFDGDGVDDAFIGNTAVGHLWLNDGLGSFSDASGNLPAASGQSTSAVAGDIDGDGDLDLISGTQGFGGDKPYRLWLNDGSGIFIDRSNRLPASRSFTTESLHLADLDDDGDLDLYVGIGFNDVILENDGAGFFQEREDWLPADWTITYGIGSTDLDGDEDTDLVLAQEAASRVLFNLRRHVSATSLARVDKSLILELRGQPGEAFIFVGSDAPDLVELPLYGTARVSYADRFVELSGSLDGQGRRAIQSPGPVSPALLGVTYYWQALIGGRLSNRETTTFSAW